MFIVLQNPNIFKIFVITMIMELVVMIKPEAMEFDDEIIRIFDRDTKSTRIFDGMALMTLPLFDVFYGHLKEHPNDFYGTFMDDLVDKTVRTAIYNGEVGLFLPVRGVARELIQRRLQQIPNAGNYVRNGVHCSSDVDAADRESRAVRNFFISY